MRLKVSVFAAVAAVAAVAVVMTLAPAAGASTTSTVNAVPIAGTTPTGGTFDGTFDIARVALSNGQLMAQGTVTGTAENAAGDTVAAVTDAPVSVPVTADSTDTCQILDLSIGTVRLDLLGLVVQLDPVHLNVSAQPGSGALVGNLLCSITHLLDNGGGDTSGLLSGLLQPTLNLLNQLLGGLLGGLNLGL
jgi:hypothetical protein